MNLPLLPILTFLPLLGGLMLLCPWPFLRKDDGAKTFTQVYSLLTFVLSLYLAGQFDWASAGSMQLVVETTWVEQFGLSFSFGIDGMSMWLVLLTTFLMPLAVLGSFNAVAQRSREFYMWLLILESAMLGTFVARDVIFFYICFEFTLIPLYFLIGIWGSKQRLKAARVFFLYTFTASLLTFASILFVAWRSAQTTGHWDFSIEAMTQAAQALPPDTQMWVLLGILAGFLVKVPVFPFHTWLPLAHTEAPTTGSVLLAGVLLKLGTYGMLRLAIPMFPQAVVDVAPIIAILAIIGILYTALICWVQKDIKKLIAYSSVSHLGFCVLGMFAIGDEVIGQTGSVMYMVNHGLSTGALFLCVGMIYDRFHTREMRKMGGLAKALPVWSFFFVFFCLASVGLPGLNGFVGEFLTLEATFIAHDLFGPVRAAVFAAVAGVGMIFGAIYILYMVGKVVFGPTLIPPVHGHKDSKPCDLDAREVAVLAPLAIACLVLGIYPKPMLKSIEPSMVVLTSSARAVVQSQALPQQVDAGGSDQVIERPSDQGRADRSQYGLRPRATVGLPTSANGERQSIEQTSLQPIHVKTDHHAATTISNTTASSQALLGKPTVARNPSVVTETSVRRHPFGGGATQ